MLRERRAGKLASAANIMAPSAPPAAPKPPSSARPHPPPPRPGTGGSGGGGGGSVVGGGRSFAIAPPSRSSADAGSGTSRALREGMQGMGLGGSAGGVGGSNLSRGSTPDTQAALDVENVGAGAAEMIQKMSKRIEALEAELEDERRFRRSAQQAARDAFSMSTAPPTSKCAAEDDNLMDVGCQTDIKANGAAGGNDAALRARCDTLSIENGALERKLSSVEEELRQLHSDNKVLWEEQAAATSLREENAKLKKRIQEAERNQHQQQQHRGGGAAGLGRLGFGGGVQRPHSAAPLRGGSGGMWKQEQQEQQEQQGKEQEQRKQHGHLEEGSDQEDGEVRERKEYAPPGGAGGGEQKDRQNRPMTPLASYRREKGDYRAEIEKLKAKFGVGGRLGGAKAGGVGVQGGGVSVEHADE